MSRPQTPNRGSLERFKDKTKSFFKRLWDKIRGRSASPTSTKSRTPTPPTAGESPPSSKTQVPVEPEGTRTPSSLVQLVVDTGTPIQHRSLPACHLTSMGIRWPPHPKVRANSMMHQASTDIPPKKLRDNRSHQRRRPANIQRQTHTY
jgi:hypothetical protein